MGSPPSGAASAQFNGKRWVRGAAHRPAPGLPRQDSTGLRACWEPRRALARGALRSEPRKVPPGNPGKCHCNGAGAAPAPQHRARDGPHWAATGPGPHRRSIVSKQVLGTRARPMPGDCGRGSAGGARRGVPGALPRPGPRPPREVTWRNNNGFGVSMCAQEGVGEGKRRLWVTLNNGGKHTHTQKKRR